MFDEARLPDHALMQDAAFARALRLCGQRPVHLPGGLLLLMQRIAGIRVAMLPRASPPADLARQLRAAGLSRRPLILSPDQPCGGLPWLKLRAPRQVALLPLTPDHACQRVLLHPKWRNQLRRAERFGMKVTCRPLPPDPQTPVLRMEVEQARQRGYLNWPAPLTAAFAKVAPDQTQVLRAHHKGRCVAHMLFLIHGRTASYHIGHVTAQGKVLGAHNLLMWRAVERMTALGLGRLDLGTLDPRTPGLNRFKLRTGAQVHDTGGTYLRWRPLARR